MRNNLRMKMNLQHFAAETNVITTEQMKKAREVDFVQKFAHDGLKKLLEALGITRLIAKNEGDELYVYTTTGTLEDGNVAEGDVIPLSQFERVKTKVGNLTLKKWRKATTAEAIVKSGKNEAIVETDKKMLKEAQKGVRANFFSYLNGSITGAITAVGAGLQAALADGWGKLQVAFEDDAVEPVYFLNPLDVSEYLGTAQISTQTLFGMKYIENFLELGTVFLTSKITKGTYVATAKENLIVYYINMNGDLADSFKLTADETGLIGFKSGEINDTRAQIESLMMSGIQMLVEYAGGVVKGEIDDSF